MIETQIWQSPLINSSIREKFTRDTIRSKILTLLSNGNYTRQEIIDYFHFQVMQPTINIELRWLEINGEIKYSPRTRTFTRK